MKSWKVKNRNGYTLGLLVLVNPKIHGGNKYGFRWETGGFLYAKTKSEIIQKIEEGMKDHVESIGPSIQPGS